MGDNSGGAVGRGLGRGKIIHGTSNTFFFMNCEKPGTKRLQDVILGGKSETTGRAGYGESPEQE